MADGTSCYGFTDSSASFYTTDSGLAGCWLSIIAGTGVGQSARIESNTGTTITFSRATEFSTIPSTDSIYNIGNIDFRAKSKAFAAEDWNFPAGSTLNWSTILVECDEQAEVYSTGRALLTYNSTAVSGVADADGTSPTWTTSHPSENFYVPGFPGYEHFVASRTDATNLVLTAAWAGPTGNYEYKIGAKLLKFEFFLNGSSTVYRTIYVDQSSSPIKVPVACKSRTMQYQISNNRVDEEVKIYAITIKEPTFFV